LVVECAGTSYIGRGGNAGTGNNVVWAFGDGTQYTTMFSTTEATTPRELLTFEQSDASKLTLLNCYGNKLTGSIPDLSANTALTYFYCNDNQLTGSIPDLSANTALDYFDCNYNQLTGSIPDLSANTALTNFYCYTNKLTGVAAGFTVPATLSNFQAQDNQLPQAAIDVILAAFVAAGRTGTNTLDIGGAGNSSPSATGLADKSTLQSRGWTVTTN